MRVACLGWGSLIWNRDGLPINSRIASHGQRNGWYEDGPMIKVEFARVSKCNRVTLVLDKRAAFVRSLWALMNRTDLAAARHALACREGTGCKSIGHFEPGDNEPDNIQGLPQWLDQKQLDAVVWTALPTKLRKNGDDPTENQILEYLKDLIDTELHQNAEEYIRKASPQIDTNYRRRIAAELGWVSTS